ncbi:hypothetical protein GCM10011609_87220 [Lentzea pudingi]|uniref:Uncharacterized protein n=1 Tax=Lentzea pudingi TaxID=1789439 RepID=A0ABQ2IUS1_9PSEU|nr:hypothetical protein GCM10011609_87220 [Lentzea pudingi]
MVGPGFVGSGVGRIDDVGSGLVAGDVDTDDDGRNVGVVATGEVVGGCCGVVGSDAGEVETGGVVCGEVGGCGAEVVG